MKKFTIGRSVDCDICLTNRRVSSKHAELWVDKHGDVWILDLGSTNGTYVDGVLANGPLKLTSGSLVFLADQSFEWESAVKTLILGLSPKKGKNRVNESEIKPVPSRKKAFSRMTSTTVLFFGLLVLIAGVVFFIARSEDSSLRRESLESGDNVGSMNRDGNVTSDGSNQQEGGSGSSLDRGSTHSRRPKWEPKNTPVVYDYSCLDDESGISQLIDLGVGIQEAMLELADREITVNEEMEVGEEAKRDILKQYKVWTNASARQRTEALFNELVTSIDNPRGIRYEVIMIDSDDVNAFTIGGKVFVFRGIYEFTESDDEFAAVLAHEIQHNERGHLTRMLKKLAIAEDLLGDAAMIPILADRIIFASFGQKDEAECDLYGVDHIVKLGYNGCAAAGLWERFSKNEKEDDFEKLLRSHPYSKDRKKCIVAHINTNYGHACQK